jgi:hypothetical protein
MISPSRGIAGSSPGSRRHSGARVIESCARVVGAFASSGTTSRDRPRSRFFPGARADSPPVVGVETVLGGKPESAPTR